MTDLALAYPADALVADAAAHAVSTARDWIALANAAPSDARTAVFERGVAALPGSWKLWRAYLALATTRALTLPLNHPYYDTVNALFERCLSINRHIPRVWTEFAKFLTHQKRWTRSRHLHNRALSELPLTQHLAWVWPSFLDSVKQSNVIEAIIAVRSRYCRIHPADREPMIEWLIENDRHDTAASMLVALINDSDYISANGKTRHQLFGDLLSLIMHHSQHITSIDVEAILRDAVTRWPADAGRLYAALASYNIKRGTIDRARQEFETALTSIDSVKDFVFLFDKYSKFLDSLINQKMKALSKSKSEATSRAVDSALEALESLIDRRPFLLNGVQLKQNPHNVDYWLHRVSLYTNNSSDPVSAIKVFGDAISAIQPSKATGNQSLARLWISFAEYYFQYSDDDNGREVLYRAMDYQFARATDLIDVIEYTVKYELSHTQFQRAKRLLEKFLNTSNSGDASAVRVNRSVRLWSLLADIEESIGSLSTVRACFHSMLSLRIITPALVLTHAHYLRQQHRYEEAFRFYEKTLTLFSPHHAMIVWLDYLHRMIERHGKSKRERIRDLFECCLEALTPIIADGNDRDHAGLVLRLWLLYAKYEEDYGLNRRACEVLMRGIKAAHLHHRFTLALTLLARVSANFGVGLTRSTFMDVIELLQSNHIDLLVMLELFARWELKLGEVDRTRALLLNAAQLTVTSSAQWDRMAEFEVEHGNEETYREMLRIKRATGSQHRLNPLKPATDDNVSIEAKIWQQLAFDKHRARKRRVRANEQHPEEESVGDDAADGDEIDIGDVDDDEVDEHESASALRPSIPGTRGNSGDLEEIELELSDEDEVLQAQVES